MITQLLIDGVDYTKFATNPLQTQDTLDESLDLVYVELKGTNEPTPFKPFADVVLKISDGVNSRTLGMLIESDEVVETISLKKYTHNTMFIEKTKWLERIFVEKAIRQPLQHKYLEGSATILPVATIDASFEDAQAVIIDRYKTPLASGRDIELLSPYEWAGEGLLEQPLHQMIQVDKYNEETGQYERLFLAEDDASNRYCYEGYTIENAQVGRYRVIYQHMFFTVAQETLKNTYEFLVIEEEELPQKYTIKDVCEQLLETAECLCVGETPLFSLASANEYSQEQQEAIQKIHDMETPEFTFNKMSLFEAFQQIGGHCHFIPRLVGNKIYFDLLGQTERQGGDLEKYCSNTLKQDTNEFCTKLDSQVSNLTNYDNIDESAISSPNNKAYRTVRTEQNTIQITEDNMFIETEYPIEKIVKLEVGYIKNGEYSTTEIGDISPYVFESSEYNTLSNFSSYYPFSKMYALKYTEGQRNITELNFQRENIISQAFEGMAILNIINNKLGWTKGSRLTNEDKFQLQFRVTYIPSTTARITQSKVNTDDIDKEISIAYNQSANKVSSSAYGEHLKGIVAKYGNVAKTKMYILPSIDLIPKAGRLFDKDYYISIVKCEYYPNYIKCEVGLSKDFNNKNEYIETNTRLQYFEYDRDIIIDRYIIREDYCVVGDGVDVSDDNKSMITNIGLSYLSSWLNGSSFPLSEVAQAIVNTYDANNNTLVKVGNQSGYLVLPVISLGIGNSIFFTFKFNDNISAGTTAYYGGTLGQQRLQEHIKYVDDYGEAKYMDFDLGFQRGNMLGYNDAVGYGSNLPFVKDGEGKLSFVEFGTNTPIIFDKGVSETPHITYQVHFVTNNDIIIGSGLASKNPYVKKQSQIAPQFYILEKEINKFEQVIDLDGLSGASLVSDTFSDGVELTNIIADKNGVAWAVCYGNELLFGKNMTIKNGDVVKMPTFTFKHKLKGE